MTDRLIDGRLQSILQIALQSSGAIIGIEGPGVVLVCRDGSISPSGLKRLIHGSRPLICQ